MSPWALWSELVGGAPASTAMSLGRQFILREGNEGSMHLPSRSHLEAPRVSKISAKGR